MITSLQTKLYGASRNGWCNLLTSCKSGKNQYACRFFVPLLRLIFGSRPLSLARPCKAAGLHQPETPSKRMKFGVESRPAKRINKIHALSKLPDIPFKPTVRNLERPNAINVFRERQKSQRSMLLYYKVPLMLVEGRGQYLFDEKGYRYLDMFGNDGTVLVGHNHPLVREAIVDQSSKLTHLSHHFLSEESTKLAEDLLSKTPSEMDSVFFVNSDTEATELAFLLARLYTKCTDLLCLRGSHFGFTHLANSASGLALYKFPVPQAHGVIHLGTPDVYRSTIQARCVIESTVKDIVSQIRSASPGVVAGCVVETLQTLGGVIPLNSDFLEQLSSVVRSRGGLMIMDEGSTGLGRIGSHYWGFEKTAIVPDIITITRGLANGLPFAAVITKQSIAKVLQSRNPLCCVAASAVLQAIENDELQENASFISSYLNAQLQQLKQKHENIIGDVRCLGLSAGIEFVKNPITKEPAPQEAGLLHEAMKNRGVLLGRGGVFGNVLRMSPPLCVVQEDIEFMTGQLDAALIQLQKTKESITDAQIEEIPISGQTYSVNNSVLNSHKSIETIVDSEDDSDESFSDSDLDSDGDSDDNENVSPESPNHFSRKFTCRQVNNKN